MSEKQQQQQSTSNISSSSVDTCQEKKVKFKEEGIEEKKRLTEGDMFDVFRNYYTFYVWKEEKRTVSEQDYLDSITNGLILYTPKDHYELYLKVKMLYYIQTQYPVPVEVSSSIWLTKQEMIDYVNLEGERNGMPVLLKPGQLLNVDVHSDTIQHIKLYPTTYIFCCSILHADKSTFDTIVEIHKENKMGPIEKYKETKSIRLFDTISTVKSDGTIVPNWMVYLNQPFFAILALDNINATRKKQLEQHQKNIEEEGKKVLEQLAKKEEEKKKKKDDEEEETIEKIEKLSVNHEKKEQEKKKEEIVNPLSATKDEANDLPLQIVELSKSNTIHFMWFKKKITRNEKIKNITSIFQRIFALFLDDVVEYATDVIHNKYPQSTDLASQKFMIETVMQFRDILEIYGRYASSDRWAQVHQLIQELYKKVLPYNAVLTWMSSDVKLSEVNHFSYHKFLFQTYPEVYNQHKMNIYKVIQDIPTNKHLLNYIEKQFNPE